MKLEFMTIKMKFDVLMSNNITIRLFFSKYFLYFIVINK